MNRSITLGHFIPGRSLLHRLDPRFKLLALLNILITFFLLETHLGMAVLLLLLLLLVYIVRVPFGYLLRGLRPIFYIALFTLVIHIFYEKGGVVLLRLGPVTVESAGISEGLFVVARLFGLVLATLLVTLTSTPLSLAQGLEYFIKPFQLIRLPVAEVTMIMTIALRFIPTVMEESQRLMRAQIARGADFESGSLFRKAHNLTPLIVPLFVSAFRRADELALAMEARGFCIGARRTRLHERKATLCDWAALFFSAALLAGIMVKGL
ncbi:MAG: energy-coupling factor transporter transmembrane protein EcfT [Dethiobacter sp.]|nr:energy-coupling factor transporter transmembrane protein EcfT [Dethiobacter sp.]